MFNIFDPYLDLIINDRFDKFCQTLSKETDAHKKAEYEKIIRKYFPDMFTEKAATVTKHSDLIKNKILTNNKKAFDNVQKVYQDVVKEHKDLYVSIARVVLNVPYDFGKLQTFRGAIKYCLFHDIEPEKIVHTVNIQTLVSEIKAAFPYVDVDDGEDCSIEFFKLIFGYIRMLTLMDRWKEYQNGKQ